MENVDKSRGQVALLTVDFQCLPKLNYAMHQNGVKLVIKFTITNNTEADITNLVVKVEPSDLFAESFSTLIDVLPKKQTIELSSYELVPNANFILQLTERLEASLHLSVANANDVLFEENYPLSVLTFNEWPGASIAPSLLASYITPNSPAIATLLNRAAAILKDWTGDSALNGYQTKDANRVRKMAGAIFEAISELNIIYSEPLASFETTGQRIRLPEDIMSSRLATCLDTAVLYAACLEAVGLYPLLVLTRGHAFAGLWLVADTMPDAVTDDLSFLSKHIGLNDIALVETTLVCDGHKASFDDACDAGIHNTANKDDFACVIDVDRCRFAGVRPLPTRILDGTQWVVDVKADEKNDVVEPQKISRWEIQTTVAAEPTKQNIWERKLLDLSLRNSLLNYCVTKKSIVLLASNVAKLEDAIWKGGDFDIQPLQKDMTVPKGDTPFYLPFNETSPLGQVLNLQLEHKRLFSMLDEADNKEALKAVYRAAKVSIEENGANSLYLALGMLEWTEPKVEKPHYAPLLLVPMELVRRGAGYALRARDEETLLNVTLVEMLRQNFQITVGGLDPLPTDESGVDVEMVFAIFRNAIMEQKGWNVLNVAVLGNFSFSKFILWNDIHSNLDALKQNKIVSSLVNGRLDWDISPITTDARQLDHTVTPSEMALPVGADSSQLEAVYSAASGKSFILHGPPGTGKSQTITNIIANALYQGKRVLFAAEKMAALSVVQERLAKIGLAPFCLEIHSNKAKKSDVLAQLQASTEVTKVKSPANFEAEAEKLFNLRQQLNAYVDALHKPSFCGVSLYEAITRYCQVEANETELLTIPLDKLLAVTPEKLNEWNTLIEELMVVGGSCGNPASHPLRYLQFCAFTPNLSADLKDLTERAVNILEQLKPLMESVPFNVSSKLKFDAMLHLSKTISQMPNMCGSLVLQTDVKSNNEHIISVLEHERRAQSICDDVLNKYTDGVFALPAESLKREWEVADQKWFLSKWLGQRGVSKKLQAFAKSPIVDAPNDLQLIIDYQNEKKQIDGQQGILAMFGAHPTATVADWEEMQAMQKGIADMQEDLVVLAADMNEMMDFKQKLAAQLADGFSSFCSFGGAVYKKMAELANQLEEVNAKLQSVAGMYTFAVADTNLPFAEGRKAALVEVGSNLNLLKDRYNYLLVRRKLDGAQMNFLLDRIESAPEVPVSEWKLLFERSFYHALADYLFTQDETLTLFKGDMFEANINRFRNVNAQYQELVKAELYARLAAKHPDFSIEASGSSEVGVLQKNLRNKGRGTSLRALFDEIPNMLSRLTPCMLMSPLSIAQYLDVKKQPKFDLVIFDEASQMPTSEAVGAIARGENVIVVGDPKQMPPTSFFSVNNVDEEAVDLNDLESILDDCLALSIPSKYLQYHYRSKHESLIAFSNSQYYESKLVTFPSPDDRVSKVSFVKVDGHYDKGKSRQNKAEAQAVVEEVVRRLSDEELRKRSIGIVTFNAVQQALIDDLLTEVFAKNPELDAFANQCSEPLFVKNLENVQGDERDVIFFSVGYGPDANGNVSMNFGPLNQVGGERRLNVAVSRARYEMKVFSTLTADMIDLNRTGAEGVRGLKEFLSFAQNGTRTLTEGDMATIRGYESISDVIANNLRNLGYQVDTQVGCSSFRIDVAVIDPNDKGRYLLGILCDGDSYYNSQTARDREICQPGILGGLGWNLLKVWTIDWWEDKQKVINRISTAIESAKKGKLKDAMAKAPTIKEVKLEAVVENTSADVAGGVSKVPYQPAVLESNDRGLDELMNPASNRLIVKQIETVLKSEAPITTDLLFHKVTAAWGVNRITQKLEARMLDLLNSVSCKANPNARQLVVWKEDADVAEYNTFRTASERDSSDVPIEEFACAMRYVLAQQVSLPLDDLKKQTSSQMGFARVGGNLDDLLMQAYAVLVQQGKLTETDGRIMLAQD